MAPAFRPILSHKMRVLLGISISIIFHILLVLFIQQLPTYLPKDKVLEVVIIENPSQNKTAKQIVTATDLPANFKQLSDDEQKALLSAFDQRVEKQTQAANNGATKNRSNSQKEENPIVEKKPSNTPKANLDPRKPGNLEVFAPTNATAPKTNKNPSNINSKIEKALPDLEKGLSTVGEVLPMDIEVGSFTALNTNQSLFYSFYNRVNEMIRFRWETAVREAIHQAVPENLSYNPLGVWNTHLEVILDRQGLIKEILLMKPSGFKYFDQAAIYAFRDSKIFPNPHVQMIDPDDGMIHLKYQFQVRYEPKIVVKSRQ